MNKYRTGGIPPQNEEVVFINLETGQHVGCSMAVTGKIIPWPDGRMENNEGRCCYEYPRYLHVEKQKLEASDFDYIIEPLTKVLQAAIATRNPVRWS